MVGWLVGWLCRSKPAVWTSPTLRSASPAQQSICMSRQGGRARPMCSTTPRSHRPSRSWTSGTRTRIRTIGASMDQSRRKCSKDSCGVGNSTRRFGRIVLLVLQIRVGGCTIFMGLLRLCGCLATTSAAVTVVSSTLTKLLPTRTSSSISGAQAQQLRVDMYYGCACVRGARFSCTSVSTTTHHQQFRAA